MHNNLKGTIAVIKSSTAVIMSSSAPNNTAVENNENIQKSDHINIKMGTAERNHIDIESSDFDVLKQKKVLQYILICCSTLKCTALPYLECN